jgi:hypothetical protein
MLQRISNLPLSAPIWFTLTAASLTAIAAVNLAHSHPAQANPADNPCYMRTSSGQVMSLGRLCQGQGAGSGRAGGSAIAQSAFSLTGVELTGNPGAKNRTVKGTITNISGKQVYAVQVFYQVRKDDTSVWVNGKDTYILETDDVMLTNQELAPGRPFTFEAQIRKAKLPDTAVARVTMITWTDHNGKSQKLVLS